MRDFQAMVNHCSLTDMASHGPLYTWCNKREGDLILKKLDRVLFNDMWVQKYPQSYNVFEAWGCSDHFRSCIHFAADTIANRRRPFKFVNAVAELADFKPMVADYWRET